MSMTPEQRRMRAQIAANARWSREDGAAGARKAQLAFLAKFEKEVDPEGVLPAAERVRRAENARKAYMQRLALRRSRKASTGRAVPEGGDAA